MSQQTVYLVTGANRGIGLQIVTQLAANPSNTVYGTARNLAGAADLKALASKHSNFKPLEADVVKPETLKKAAAVVANESGHIDVLLANAGVGDSVSQVKDLSKDALSYHWEVNTWGSVSTYQAFRTLLLTSKQKKLVFVSTLLGSVNDYLPIPTTAYGASKASLNYLVRAIASESKEEGLIVLSIHPGLVATDMSAAIDEKVNFAKLGISTITPKESAEGIIAQVEKLTETDQFLDYTGAVHQW
ncbi:unnamed protein product [Kuraishia capsulata CBS 1993]|uniref:NAD(P)-binding protein n=1 Tax=Kuraishia capsulata CBS 1993 TaxID=1382522 RepID=W6MK35_9ASCO|nr:uncharacterized protein KUCA_T00000909001 [Kuraishia capsulata CBS 1993]CDK24942.1 unnamed protein product [Kuraishia capsulata CBS 1993]